MQIYPKSRIFWALGARPRGLWCLGGYWCVQHSRSSAWQWPHAQEEIVWRAKSVCIPRVMANLLSCQSGLCWVSWGSIVGLVRAVEGNGGGTHVCVCDQSEIQPDQSSWATRQDTVYTWSQLLRTTPNWMMSWDPNTSYQTEKAGQCEPEREEPLASHQSLISNANGLRRAVERRGRMWISEWWHYHSYHSSSQQPYRIVRIPTFRW